MNHEEPKGEEATLSLYSHNSGFDEAWTSHTDESKSKPSHALQAIFFTLDAISATTLSVSRLDFQLRIC